MAVEKTFGNPVRGFVSAILKMAAVPGWLRHYNRKHAPRDAISGLTLAAYVLPASMAYAGLAGLPPQAGIYSYIAGGLVFAWFTQSRQASVGPTSAISLLVGATLAAIPVQHPAQLPAYAAAIALLTGIMAILAYVTKLATLASFISETILLGFKTGAAISIALIVLPGFLGLESQGTNFWEKWQFVFSEWKHLHLPSLLTGCCMLAMLALGTYYFPGKPAALFIAVLTIAGMVVTPLSDAGLRLLGPIPQQLQPLAFPPGSVQHFSALLDVAFACFILMFIESISAVRSIANTHQQTIDARRELLALGMANIGAGMAGGYPVAAGLSQSAVNDRAGAKTPLSLVICAGALIAFMLFLSYPLQYLPAVFLTAIVLQAMAGLLNFKAIRKLWYLDRREFLIAIVAMSGVLFAGILKGVMIATLLSLALVLMQSARPYIAELGSIGTTDRYSDIGRHPENITLPHILILRVESSLLYFNASYVFDEILRKIDRSDKQVQALILDFSATPWVDVAGSAMIAALDRHLRRRNISLKIADPLAQARDILRKQGLEKSLGHLSRRIMVHDAVLQAKAELSAAKKHQLSLPQSGIA